MPPRDISVPARVTVMGLGGFGGGEGAARYLAERGARVTVTDLRSKADLADPLGRLSDLPLVIHLGEHVESDFTDTDLIVVNPAVKPDSPYLALARAAGVALDTAINLFLRQCPAPVVGVTGSNGKSTVAKLACEMLRRGPRRAWLGGNIGGSLLGELDRIAPGDVVVLELSSFQLDRLPWGGRAPTVGVALNVTPNHLDWHGDFAAYAGAKRNLVAMQGAGDVSVLFVDDPVVGGWANACGGRPFFVRSEGGEGDGAVFGERAIRLRLGEREETVSLGAFRLPGHHSRGNAACAASAAWLMGATRQAMEEALAAFAPLPHRLETVAVAGGVRYVEDSVSTTPESTIAALGSFEGPVYLIAGGSPKGADFAALGRAIAERVSAVALIGRAADEIERAVLACPAPRAETIRVGALRDAFEALRQRARSGSVVLLSPGCASFDMFRNYVHRAEQFRALVEEAAKEGG